MTQQILLGLAGIVTLGIAAQWLAWRLRIPSILMLLAFGLVIGPATNLLRPTNSSAAVTAACLFGRRRHPL